MATSSHDLKSIAPFNQGDVRHSKDDALSPLAFERLFDASYGLDPIEDLETQFILLVCGRLGLRRGELAHMKAEWIDWRKQRIVIPDHQRCRKGRDGGICGMCRQHAEQMTRVALDSTAETVVEIHRELDREDGARLRDFGPELRAIQKAMNRPADELLELTDGVHDEERAHELLTDAYREDHLEAALESRWSPKTENAAREVPFGFSPRAEIALERYFMDEAFPQWMYSAQAVNRRVNSLAERVDVGRVTPHTLRATAADYHAGRLDGDPFALKAMFGWASIETAKSYIGENTDSLDRKLKFAHR